MSEVQVVHEVVSMSAGPSKSPPSFNKTRPSVVPPVTSEDDRPAISDLLEKYSTQVKEIIDLLKDDPNYKPGTIHDDLWVLRYYLSQKNIRKAAQAAKATFRFRKEYKLDELDDIRHDYLHKLDIREYSQEQSFWSIVDDDAVIHTISNRNLGVVSYFHLKDMNQKRFVDESTEEDALEFYIHYNEWLFQVHDEITRRTGRLTKCVKVVDLKDLTLRDVCPAYVKRDGKVNKKLQDFYPQSLACMLVINAPLWFESVWSLLRPFFPKRLVEKINVVNPKKRAKDLKCFTKYISEKDLPEKYGGSMNEWPPPCEGKKTTDNFLL